jgi:iron(III) transport system substrate-binding protein
MLRNLLILGLVALVVAAPLVFQQASVTGGWKPGDPELVITSPHNECIQYEFEQAFTHWHHKHHGAWVKIDWRNLGGTSEISRYLTSEYVAAFRGWWKSRGKPWPAGAEEMLLKDTPPAEAGLDQMWQAWRQTDDPRHFGGKIDLFFGGGEFDHQQAYGQGLTLPPWPAGQEPAGLFGAGDGTVLIPESLSGETWRRDYLFGAVLSTFGICYNLDRLQQLGVARPPERWEDLTDPVYFGQLGLADPTKSGSIAKAFEMIIQEQIAVTLASAGITPQQIAGWERQGGQPPAAYEALVGRGWENGLRLIQRLSANARYFTDSASKVPIDVSMGDAAAGLAIDFYARFQAELSRAPDDRERMRYITPGGGSSVSADPISLLRGAPHRTLAVRFIEFVLSADGQRLWNDAPGKPCSRVKKYALRRLPIRRDFYPPGQYPEACATDNLADPAINPYTLAQSFTYRPRWTGRHFSMHRDLIRCMCLDAGDELRAAWRAILDHGGPSRQPEAMALLGQLPGHPEPVTWQSAADYGRRHKNRLDYMREWTTFYRTNYRKAAEQAAGTPKEAAR